MCGLAGYSGTGVDARDLMILLMFAQARGKDSVGIYSNSKVLKSIGTPMAFVKENPDDIYAMCEGSKMAMLHSRASTMGGVSTSTAHPFIFKVADYPEGVKYDKQVIGAHNGWLFPTYLEDMAEAHGIETPNIDSKLIYEILIKNEMDFNSLATIEGTMALSFVTDGLLHLYRRTSKPLYWGAKKHGIFYSSIEKALLVIGCKNVTQVAPNLMYQFKEGKLVNTIYVPDANIVKNLSEDVGMNRWREEAGKEVSNQIPTTSLTTRKWTKKYPDSRENTARSPVGSITGRGNKESQDLFIDGRLKDIAIEHELELPDFKFKIWDVQARDAFVLVKAVEAGTNLPVKDTTILCPDSDGECQTDENGHGILYFNKFKGETRLYTGDPKSKKVMYSMLFNVKRGRVLEVTLKLPFRSAIKAAEENKDKSGGSGVPVQDDGGSEKEAFKFGTTDPLPYSEESLDLTDNNCFGSNAERSCGSREQTYPRDFEAVRSRFALEGDTFRNPFDKKDDMCEMFNISHDIPNVTLELLELKNTQLFESQEEINYLKSEIDIGHEFGEAEREHKVNRIIQMESYVRNIEDDLNEIIDKYKL